MPLGRLLLQDCITDGTIEAYRQELPLHAKDLVIGTNSIDVTLSNKFVRMYPRDSFAGVDPWAPSSLCTESFSADTYTMRPGECLLGCTRERFVVVRGRLTLMGHPVDVAPMYDGRSTCGRLFLASHITAGYGDVGFGSAWTLELKNMSEYPLVLHAEMRIGQVSFDVVHGAVGDIYSGAYVEQHDAPRPPVLGKERFL